VPDFPVNRWGRVVRPLDARDCLVRVETAEGKDWTTVQEWRRQFRTPECVVIERRIGRPDGMAWMDTASVDALLGPSGRYEVAWLDESYEPPTE
jgi:hypothetical protein